MRRETGEEGGSRPAEKLAGKASGDWLPVRKGVGPVAHTRSHPPVCVRSLAMEAILENEELWGCISFTATSM